MKNIFVKLLTFFGIVSSILGIGFFISGVTSLGLSMNALGLPIACWLLSAYLFLGRWYAITVYNPFGKR